MQRRYRMFMVGWPEPTDIILDGLETDVPRLRSAGFIHGKLCGDDEAPANALVPLNRIQLLVEVDS